MPRPDGRPHRRPLPPLWAVPLVLVLAAAPALARTITPVVGPGGDGNGHELHSAWGIAADSAGNVYVTGTQSDNVLMITPGGAVTQILDGSGDGAGHAFHVPTEILVGPDDTLYVIGTGGPNVFKRPAGGSWSQILDAAGDGGSHPLSFPSALAADGDGNVFVADANSDCVFRITAGGAVSTVLTASGDGGGHPLDEPHAVISDADGNIYVAGARSNNVLKVTPAGVITQVIAAGPGISLDYPSVLQLDADGSLLVGAFSSHNALRVAPGGAVTLLVSGLDVMGLGVRDDGMVFVAGSNQHKIVGLRAGGPNCPLVDSSGDGTTPMGVAAHFAVVGSDRIYIANSSYDTVFLIEDGCEGPTTDLTGLWHVSLTSDSDLIFPDSEETQEWVQAGFSVTVSDPTTSTVKYTGTIDDSNHFSLFSTATSCLAPGYCCPFNTYYGDGAADASGFTGTRTINSWNHLMCQSTFTSNAVGSHCGNGQLDSDEACEDGNDDDGDGCDAACEVEPCYQCGTGIASCSAAMRGDCAVEQRGSGVTLTLTQGPDSRRDSFKWKLARTAATSLGDPTATTGYRLCAFDRSGATPSVLFSASVAAGTDWQVRGSGGFRYRPTSPPGDGITEVFFRTTTTTKAAVTGKGSDLRSWLSSLPVPLPLTLQLQSDSAGCVESNYSAGGVVGNDATRVKLRATP